MYVSFKAKEPTILTPKKIIVTPNYIWAMIKLNDFFGSKIDK